MTKTFGTSASENGRSSNREVEIMGFGGVVGAQRSALELALSLESLTGETIYV
jgi:hypothetical protein